MSDGDAAWSTAARRYSAQGAVGCGLPGATAPRDLLTSESGGGARWPVPCGVEQRECDLGLWRRQVGVGGDRGKLEKFGHRVHRPAYSKRSPRFSEPKV